MQNPPRSAFKTVVRAALVLGIGLLALASTSLHAQTATGTITGRILNEGTGQYLRSAIVTVPSTNLSTVAEAGGTYVLTGVPAGTAWVVVSYAGLDPAETTVNVAAGQTVTQNFNMTAKGESTV